MADASDLIALAARELNFLSGISGDDISPDATRRDVAGIVDAVREAGIAAAAALYEVIEAGDHNSSPVVIRNSPPLLRRVVHRDDAGRITEVVDEPLRRST